MYGLVAVAGIILAAYAFHTIIAVRLSDVPASDHFDGEHFFNPAVPARAEHERTRRKSVWIWMLTHARGAWNAVSVLPAIPPEREREQIRITYVNHATALIQVDGVNILTDPMWSYRASPLPFLGPARYADPGISFDNLPPIDIVLLSHNHYDHMDLPTLKRIRDAWNPRIYTPLGNSAYLSRRGIPGAIDMDWWEERADGAVRITCVPAQHFSARTFSDRNRALWGGFVLQAPSGSVYFAGDTGFGPFVGEIARRFEGFDVALIPIGAYEPAWMMQLVHANPEEAIRMHDLLGVKTSIGIHYGTFRLTDEPQEEPARRIAALKGARDFRTPPNGGAVLSTGRLSGNS